MKLVISVTVQNCVSLLATEIQAVADVETFELQRENITDRTGKIVNYPASSSRSFFTFGSSGQVISQLSYISLE